MRWTTLRAPMALGASALLASLLCGALSATSAAASPRRPGSHRDPFVVKSIVVPSATDQSALVTVTFSSPFHRGKPVAHDHPGCRGELADANRLRRARHDHARHQDDSVLPRWPLRSGPAVHGERADRPPRRRVDHQATPGHRSSRNLDLACQYRAIAGAAGPARVSPPVVDGDVAHLDPRPCECAARHLCLALVHAPSN